jgi:ribosomal protein S18 acetylase RimI-like enzyme
LIRTLTESDAGAFASLRREALAESPLSFGASPETDLASLRSGTILGAFQDAVLVASVGLMRGAHAKSAHRVYLWGMYVKPGFRGRGIGAELLQAAIEHARAMAGVEWVVLGVTSNAAAARRLYERAGFTLWGTEPDALRYDGQSVAEHHYALRLERRRPAG